MKLSFVQRSLFWISSLNDPGFSHADVKRLGLSDVDIEALRRITVR